MRLTLALSGQAAGFWVCGSFAVVGLGMTFAGWLDKRREARAFEREMEMMRPVDLDERDFER